MTKNRTVSFLQEINHTFTLKELPHIKRWDDAKIFMLVGGMITTLNINNEIKIVRYIAITATDVLYFNNYECLICDEPIISGYLVFNGSNLYDIDILGIRKSDFEIIVKSGYNIGYEFRQIGDIKLELYSGTNMSSSIDLLKQKLPIKYIIHSDKGFLLNINNELSIGHALMEFDDGNIFSSGKWSELKNGIYFDKIPLGFKNFDEVKDIINNIIINDIL